MFRVFGLLVVICATCLAGPATLPASPKVSCEELPLMLPFCANMPSYPVNETKHQTKCSNGTSSDRTCDEVTCDFRERGWMTDLGVNFTKLNEVLDQYSSDFPDWTPAFQQAKTTCFVKNLPVNVYNINCPVYDITFCVFAAVIKNTPPSSWSSSPICAASRQYSETCPECPECFARAFHALPR